MVHTKEIKSLADLREMWASNDPNVQYILQEDIDAGGLMLLTVGPKRFNLCAGLGSCITGLDFISDKPFEGFSGRLIGVHFHDCNISENLFGSGLGVGGVIDSCSFNTLQGLTVYGPERNRVSLYQASIFVEERRDTTYLRLGLGLDDPENYPAELYLYREALVSNHLWILRASKDFEELLVEIRQEES